MLVIKVDQARFPNNFATEETRKLKSQKLGCTQLSCGALHEWVLMLAQLPDEDEQ